MRVAVCVVTYRRPQGLHILLQALRKLRVPAAVELALVVVDNDPERSAAATVARARRRLPWPIRYVEEPARGVSFARNAALAATEGFDFIAFIDDDEEPEPDWLAELLACQAATGAAAVTGPQRPRLDAAAPAWLRMAFELSCVRPKPGRPHNEITTGNLLVCRRTLTAHGLRFDLGVALVGGEDTLLGQELRRAGEAIAWAERAVVHERIPASRARLPWLLRRWYRTGNIEALLAMRERGRLVGSALGVLGGAARLGLGGAALVAALPWLAFGRRERPVRRLYTVARGLGMLAMVAGRRLEEYRTIHGA